MQIYSFNEHTHELLINTLREVDYIDACTPAIPMSAVVADQPLPVFGKHQALIVRNDNEREGYLTVSENVSVIEDYREICVYNTENGLAETITKLGSLPENVTTQEPPDRYHEWDGQKWVEKAEADELRLRDQRRSAGSLSRFQFLSEIEIKLAKNKDELVSIAEQNLTGIRLIKVRNTILESQNFDLSNDDLWSFLTETIKLSIEELFNIWQEAHTL